ncbi:MAG: hypothetical protein JXB88_25550 [Spirochaetales bacterium]|nr:hypothetical protein [Spirochaetales bacterium]
MIDINKWDKIRRKGIKKYLRITDIPFFIVIAVIIFFLFSIPIFMKSNIPIIVFELPLFCFFLIVVSLGAKIHKQRNKEYNENDKIYFSQFCGLIREKPNFKSKIIKVINDNELSILKNKNIKKYLMKNYNILEEGDMTFWRDPALTDPIQGNWYKIEFEGIEGWVFAY